MHLRKILPVLAAAFACIGAKAQFYTGGDDPGAVRWSTFRSAHYKMIYPAGMDSLARVYARSLEDFRPQVSRSIGYLPGGMYRRPMPVVLHAFGGEANGSVSWAPMRMDLYTLPDAYSPEPMPWITSLAVHENRHVAQLQFAADGAFRPLKWLVGEVFTGAAAGIWPGPWFLEGDAVVAETALTPFGRGRQGEFLAYYRAAFDRGDWRNWDRWLHGSYRLMAPNHYALGYLTLAGARTLYDEPLFAADYLRGTTRHPLRLFQSRKALRKVSGASFNGAFREIQQAFGNEWAAEDRGPWTPARPVTEVPSWFTSQTGPVPYGDGILAVSASKRKAAELVFLKDGRSKPLHSFASGTSALRTDGSRIYWSETIPHVRWGLAATSRIRFLEDGKIRDLTRSGRLYNPAPSPDGRRIAVTSYPTDGSTEIRILSQDGALLQQQKAPAGVQYVETAWVGNDLYVSYIDDNGTGIARWDLSAAPVAVLQPGPVSIAHLAGRGDGLYFTSDRTGVGEIYRLSPDGRLFQLTATPYGASSFTFRGDTLYFSALQYEGRLLQEAALPDLPAREVNWTDVVRWRVAEKLAAQEQALAREAAPLTDRSKALSGGEFSEPRPYRKLPGILHLHSWAPVYFDYDRIDDMSGDLTWREAGVGATALFQNLLGTSDASLGYSYHPDTYSDAWRHSAHGRLTWSGWFPVFELAADLNDRSPITYIRRREVSGDQSRSSLRGQLQDGAAFQASVKAYVPLNFSSGGWQRGLVPQLRYTWSNDRFNKGLMVVRLPEESQDEGQGSEPQATVSVTDGRILRMQTLTASVRGYVIRSKASAQEYPRWGLGLETGYRTRIGLDDIFSGNLYAYAYGYLPGFTLNQGLRLSATWQHQNAAPVGENAVTVRPRGFADSDLSAFLASYAREQMVLTADYAIPVWVGDISWFSPLAYITHFVVKPHADWLHFSLDRGLNGSGDLFSLGGEVTARLANFLWFPFETSVGVSLDWNGGHSFDLVDNVTPLRHTYVGGIFNINF